MSGVQALQGTLAITNPLPESTANRWLTKVKLYDFRVELACEKLSQLDSEWLMRLMDGSGTSGIDCHSYIVIGEISGRD